MFSRSFSAFLFDMDGTLINSIASAERVWGAWASRHGLDVAAFLPTIHGVRAIETIRNTGLPDLDATQELADIVRAEIEDVADIVPIEGVLRLLAALPADRWAIVTSASRDLAVKRLRATGLAPPAVLITAEDVAAGKPAPDCFILAARRLGVDVRDCLVFGDAPAGIQAAEAAGAAVVVIGATHRHPYETAHPVIASYAEVDIAVGPEGLRLRRVPPAA